MIEIWKPIAGYPSYEVSDMGNVRRVYKSKNKILSPAKDRTGYLKVCIGPHKTRKTGYLHRLVDGAFIEQSGEGKFVNHIDGNPLNNSLENIEYVSCRENINHSLRMRRGGRTGCSLTKEGKYQSKITIKGKYFYLGLFKTEQEAHEAYLKAAKEVGEDKYASDLNAIKERPAHD